MDYEIITNELKSEIIEEMQKLNKSLMEFKESQDNNNQKGELHGK